jgi:PiT family inorganic phosphate transporter
MMVKKVWVLSCLILIGLVPLAYSLNKNLDTQHLQSFHQLSSQTAVVLNQIKRID